MLVTEAPTTGHGFIPTTSNAAHPPLPMHPQQLRAQPAPMNMRPFYASSSSFVQRQLPLQATGTLPTAALPGRTSTVYSSATPFLPGAIAPPPQSFSAPPSVPRMPATTSLHNPPSLMQLRMMQRNPQAVEQQAITTQLHQQHTTSVSSAMFVSPQHFYPVEPFVPLHHKRRRRRRRCRKTTRNRQFTEMNSHLLSIADIGEDDYDEEDDSNDNDELAEDSGDQEHEDAEDDQNGARDDGRSSVEIELSAWWAEYASAQLLPEVNPSCDQVEKLQATIRRGLKYHEQAPGFFSCQAAERTDSEASKDNRWSIRSEDSFAINLDQLLGSDDEQTAAL